MKIDIRYYGSIAILDLQGKLIFGGGDVQFRQAVLDVLEDGYKNILINMAGVTTIDSSGLGELIRSKATAAGRGSTIKLLHLSPKVYDLLEVTRLIGVFEMYDDEVEAIPSFWDGEEQPAETPPQESR